MGESVQSTRSLRADPDFQRRLEGVTPRVYVAPALIAVNVLVFVAMLAGGAGLLTPNPLVHLEWGSNFGPLTTHGQWWRLVTCTFLHFGVLHLAFNMWALYENGRVVERLYGNLYFLALYLFAGVSGSLASVLWHPTVNSAGASGAIFGVLGAMLAFTVIMHQSVPVAARKAQRNSAIVFIAYALISGFNTPGIDNAAHLGGLVGGFLAGLVLARPLEPVQRKPGGIRRYASVAIISLTAILVLVSLLNGSTNATMYVVRAALDAQKGGLDGLDGAIANATHAIEIDPKLLEAYLIRSYANLEEGDLQGAISDSSLALEIDPKSWKAYLLRADAKVLKGDLQGAISDSSLALEIDPKSWKAYLSRGRAKERGRDFEGAIGDLSRATEINPDYAFANDALARLLATAEQSALRDGRRALKYALRACELSQWKEPSYIDTLAAAYARTGDFVKAVEWQRKATADPKLKGNTAALQRLELYQAGKAWPPD